jgi:hypothetical protein
MTDAPRQLIVDQPVAGYYRRRLVKGGPWVPVEIAPYGGEFTALVATVGGVHADLFDTWTSCAGQPISKADYDYMMAVKEWADEHAPCAPEARPYKRVEISKLPPAF